MKTKWVGTVLVVLGLGAIVSSIAFVGSGGSFLWALKGFGLGTCLALGVAVIGMILTRFYDCQEGDPF